MNIFFCLTQVLVTYSSYIMYFSVSSLLNEMMLVVAWMLWHRNCKMLWDKKICHCRTALINHQNSITIYLDISCCIDTLFPICCIFNLIHLCYFYISNSILFLPITFILLFHKCSLDSIFYTVPMQFRGKCHERKYLVIFLQYMWC